MSLPRITIITPSYNQGHFIEETICSVLGQGYPNLEYIIIDGGSTDRTVEIIKKYERYISYWVSEKDQGQSHAINKGFHKATGEIVNWLNSDDYYAPDALKTVAEAFASPGVNVFCGRSRVFGVGSEYFSQGTDLYSDNLLKTIGWARIDQPETFFRHAVLKEIGYVNESLHFTMDKEMWIRYLLRYGLSNVVSSDKMLVNYRLHDTSKTVSLQAGFTRETRSLYYTYSKRLGLAHFASFLEKDAEIKELALSGYEGLLTKEDACKIVNYYFLEQVLMKYAQDNYSAAKAFLAQTDLQALTPDERKEVDKIRLRMKVPVGIKKAFHALTQKK